MQLRLLSAAAIFITVFGAGLVSCGPDQKVERDHFQLSPPIMLRSDRSEWSWALVSSGSLPPFTTSDRLRFGEEARRDQIDLAMTAHCAVQNAEVEAVTSWNAPSELILLQVLPREVILNPEATPVPCSLKFVARNGHGSLHLFELHKIWVTPTAAGYGLALKRESSYVDPQTETVLEIDAEQWSRHYVVPTRSLAKMGLLCEKHNLPARPDQGPFPLALFDVRTAQAVGQHQAELGEFPVQYCRVVEYGEKSRLAVSSLLKVHFPSGNLIIEPDFSDRAMSGPDLGVIRVTNRNGFPIFLHVPPVLANSAIWTEFSSATHAAVQIPLRFANRPPSSILKIASGATVSLRLQTAGKISCRLPQNQLLPSQGHALYFPAPITVEQVVPETAANVDGPTALRRVKKIQLLEAGYSLRQSELATNNLPRNPQPIEILSTSAQSRPGACKFIAD